ncbi:MAG: hypothetical protein FJX74_13370 [Armatimonadetes bacterium]|nr:hypothetical protein [Armatimonadota bacterium]
MARTALALIAAAALTALCAAQPPPGPGLNLMAPWSFEEGVGPFMSADPAASASTTDDANLTRGAEAGAAMEYAFTAAAGKLAGVFAPTEGDLTTLKSVRLWLRTSEPAIMLIALTEADGSNYHAAFMSLPDRWQEIALDLGEFTLGDDSTDENGRLDPGQVGGAGIVDATGFLAQMALQVPMLQAPELGARVLWLDDVELSAEGVPPRWEETQVGGKRAVRLDSFEASPLQWIALAGKGLEVDYDPDLKAHGDFSLRLQYDLPPDKVIGIMTAPAGPNLEGLSCVRVWLVSEVDATVIISAKERDDSEYTQMIELTAGDELQPYDLDVAGFSLNDDSADENGQLDLTQLKELSIADVSVLAGKPVPVNTLWIDDLVFTE